MSSDAASVLSPAFFAEFALPYAKQVIDHFGGFCSFHYCVLADHLLVEITVPGEGETRRLVLRGVGSSWAARWERLEQELEAWMVQP